MDTILAVDMSAQEITVNNSKNLCPDARLRLLDSRTIGKSLVVGYYYVSLVSTSADKERHHTNANGGRDAHDCKNVLNVGEIATREGKGQQLVERKA